MSGSLDNSGPPPDPQIKPSRDGRPSAQLPPPAFPPGQRRVQLRRQMEPSDSGSEDTNAAFTSPDAPIRERAAGFEDAFISPDDPIPLRTSDFESALISPDDPIPERAALSVGRTPESDAPGAGRFSTTEASGPAAHVDEGVATGIGSDAHLDPAELSLGGDPFLGEVVDAVHKLAAALQRRGESGLRATPEMTRLEAQLRAYCVGYLAGRRAEDQES